MAAEVHSITRDTDVGRLAAAPATVRRSCGCDAATDLADLLETVAGAVAARLDPPMSEGECWRWSATVGTARRVSRKWGAVNAAEVLADEQLIEALRSGLTVDAGPLGDRLAEWRDAARLDEPLQGAAVSASSGAATASAPAVRCEGLESARAGGSGDLSVSTLPTITAAGPDATDRPGGGTNGPGWVAARDRAVRAAADHAAEINKAALARQHAADVAACRNLINTLLCERCNNCIPAGDCPCRTWRPEPKATR